MCDRSYAMITRGRMSLGQSDQLTSASFCLSESESESEDDESGLSHGDIIGDMAVLPLTQRSIYRRHEKTSEEWNSNCHVLERETISSTSETIQACYRLQDINPRMDIQNIGSRMIWPDKMENTEVSSTTAVVLEDCSGASPATPIHTGASHDRTEFQEMFADLAIHNGITCRTHQDSGDSTNHRWQSLGSNILQGQGTIVSNDNSFFSPLPTSFASNSPLYSVVVRTKIPRTPTSNSASQTQSSSSSQHQRVISSPQNPKYPLTTPLSDTDTADTDPQQLIAPSHQRLYFGGVPDAFNTYYNDIIQEMATGREDRGYVDNGYGLTPHSQGALSNAQYPDIDEEKSSSEDRQRGGDHSYYLTPTRAVVYSSVTENGTEVDLTDDVIVNNQDSAESMQKDLVVRTGFLNLFLYGYTRWSEEKLVKSICDGNPDIGLEFAYRMRNSLKMVFTTKKKRDRAVKQRIAINQELVRVEKSHEQEIGLKPRTRRKVVHLFGLPITEKEKDITNYLESYGLSVIGSQRWMTCPGTNVKNSGRSFLVRSPIGKDIPGYIKYPSFQLKRNINVKLWYPGRQDWCSRCTQPGHLARECPLPIWKQRTACNLQSKTQTSDAEPHHHPNYLGNQSPEEIQKAREIVESYKNNIVSFNIEGTAYPELSNSYPHEITIDNQLYSCNEQFLMLKKASLLQNMDIFNKIKISKHADDIKRLGESLPPPGGSEEVWRKIAWNLLWDVNVVKFSTSEDMRKKLFTTRGNLLVEASRDKYWGCGYASGDIMGKCPNQYTGFNAFGIMLTLIRRWLMHVRFPEDDDAAKLQAERSYSLFSSHT